MTMNFDMNGSNLGNAFSNSASLAPNKIHEVLFKGLEYSQSKDGKWEFMRIKFQGVDGGFFTDSTFGFDKDAGVRQKTQYGENPSAYESFMMKIKHLINAVAPELLAKMQAGEIVFTPKGKSDLFKQYVVFIGEQLESYKDAKTTIKLVQNKKGEAAFPTFFAGVSKEGIAYMKSNFIGNNLSFSQKEKEAMGKVAAARPTVMADTNDNLSLDSETPVNEASTSDDLLNMDL